MKIVTKNIDEFNSNYVICFTYENNSKPSELLCYLDGLSNGNLLKQILEYKVITGKYQESFKYSINKNLKVLVYGLGKKKELTRKKLSNAIASAARIAKVSQINSLAIELIDEIHNCSCIEKNIQYEDLAQITLCALRIGLYEFDKYLSKKNKQVDIVELVCKELNSEIESGAQKGAYISYAMKFTKDLVNEQAQIVTPDYIAKLAKQIGSEYNLETQIFDKKQIKEMGMKAFLAVGQGSVNEPKFIHLTYKPKNTPTKKIALVGKGITFDSGGMNIKPATSMLTMKDDMTGAATVLAVIQAIAYLKPDIELHVISALCENMTSGGAYKQGDVLTAMNGKTIEVDNTDAEGRITLADALCYCDKLDVDEVIDIATLTGAVLTALGKNITAVLGNNQDQINKFIEISKKSCENTWQMPILDELKNNLKSDIADFKNTGGRNAGTSTAAWFLSNFTKSKSWLHLDIAGTAYLEGTNGETISGPTGVMVRSLINYLLA